MSERTYEFVIRSDTSYPESRDVLITRMRAILAYCSGDVPDERTTCFLRGFLLGLVLGHVIGHADADDLKEMVPQMPPEVRDGIPFGIRDGETASPEVDAIPDLVDRLEQVPEDWGFHHWMGITNDRYYYERHGMAFPNASIWAWLGYLNAELVSGRITQTTYEKLRALLQPIVDDPTPFLAPLLKLDPLLVKRAQRELAGKPE